MSARLVPIWQTIADDLDAQIEKGALKPGDRLPTEHELARHYAVNRHTVRRALHELVMANRIDVTQGRGSFVCFERIAIDYTKSVYAPEVFQILPDRSAGDASALETMPAGAGLAEALNIKQGDDVAKFNYHILTQSGDMLALTTRSVPLARFKGVLEAYKHCSSLPKALESIGVRNLRRQWVRLRSRVATSSERSILHIDKYTPLLLVGCLFTDPSGAPVLHDVSRFASDRVDICFSGTGGVMG